MFVCRIKKSRGKEKTLVFIRISLLLFLFFSGCTSLIPTKPNDMFQGEYPACFSDIQNKNALLAQEIGKLPELHDGIQNNDTSAISLLCKIYNENGKLFDDFFKKIYNVGLPDVRKYCSPLQAVFWIAQKGDEKKVKNVIYNYSLKDLLSQAWKFDPPTLTDDEIAEIIESISDNELKQRYQRDIKTSTNAQIQRLMQIDLRSNRRAFSRKARKLLTRKKILKHPRWEDFTTVTERLNSPALINYYEQSQISWVFWRTLPSWPVSIRYVFNNGKGDCTGIADFTAFCLKRAGYEAYEWKIDPMSPNDAHHSICVYYDGGIKYVMDSGHDVSYRKGIFLYDDYVDLFGAYIPHEKRKLHE